MSLSWIANYGRTPRREATDGWPIWEAKQRRAGLLIDSGLLTIEAANQRRYARRIARFGADRTSGRGGNRRRDIFQPAQLEYFVSTFSNWRAAPSRGAAMAVTQAYLGYSCTELLDLQVGDLARLIDEKRFPPYAVGVLQRWGRKRLLVRGLEISKFLFPVLKDAGHRGSRMSDSGWRYALRNHARRMGLRHTSPVDLLRFYRAYGAPRTLLKAQ